MTIERTIAVFLPNWVGDVVMATPTLRSVRGHWPGARIVHVGREIALATMSGTAWADETIADVSRHKPRLVNSLRHSARLRAARIDLAILLPNSFRVAALARLAGIRRLAGYDRDGRGWMLSDKLAPPRDRRRFTPISAVDYYIDLAGMLGVACGSRRMELPVTEADAREADAMLREAGVDDDRPLVMLNPGASFGSSKMWATDRYAELADALIDRHGAQVIINAAPSERAIAGQVGAAMRGRPSVNFAERDNTLGLLKGLMRRCTLLVTNDTGARHIAAAMGIGVVTLFGSTDPRWAEINYEYERIVRVDVPCSPCQSKVCSQPSGPTHHQCMTAITVAMVLAACEDVLARLAAGRGEGGT